MGRPYLLRTTVVGAVLLGLGGVASAAKVDDRLETATIQVDDVVRRTGELEDLADSGKGFISPSEAVRRFEEAVYQRLIGEYDTASEGLFTLVTTEALVGSGYHRDAEWHLAEALVGLGNLATAEARFLVVVEDMGHPFRSEGVLRLLELYAVSNQMDAFERLYEKEILSGRVAPNDVVTYSVAKAFWLGKDLAKSKGHFLEVENTSPYYGRARYFLGAIAVEEKDLDAAIPYFEEVKGLNVDSPEARQVLDLALLAVARIHYERDEHEKAEAVYNSIGGDSQYHADRLYEIVWSYIRSAGLIEGAEDKDKAARRDLYGNALMGVEQFLLAFPEHQYTAQLKLLQGHLAAEQLQYDTALVSYEKVAADYSPIRDRFAQLASSDDVGREYFHKVAKEGLEAAAEGIPSYATAMVVADPDLSRAMTMYRELETQNADVRRSEEMAAELGTYLDTSSTLGRFERIRVDSKLTLAQASQAQFDLLGAESDWIGTRGSGDIKRRLDAIVVERDAVKKVVGENIQKLNDAQTAIEVFRNELARLQADATAVANQVHILDGELALLRVRMESPEVSAEAKSVFQGQAGALQGDLSSAKTRLDALKADLRARPVPARPTEAERILLQAVTDDFNRVRAQLVAIRSSVEPASETGTRFDDQQQRVTESLNRLRVLRQRLDGLEAVEFERIKERFSREVEELDQERLDLAATSTRAERVSLELTRRGFGRLEDFFAESVLRADIGVVDVFWAQKLDLEEKLEKTTVERNRLAEELKERFNLMKRRLSQ